MDKEKLEERARELLNNPNDSQEFTDLFSGENWDKIDKKMIKVPRQTQLSEEECPECDGEIRIIFRKFNPNLTFFSLVCPHCKKKIGVESEYTGYSAEIMVEEYRPDVHGE